MFNLFSKGKIDDGLNKSSSKLSSSLVQIFTHKKLDDEVLENLEEALISSDIGVETSFKIIEDLRKKKFSKNIDENEIRQFLAEEIEKILNKNHKKLDFSDNKKPQVIVFNGVNGAGKTTTIGKIAANLKNQNKKVLIAACDTFRAGATKQLEIWAQKSDCEIITANKEGEDPASVAYRALEYGKKNAFDVLLIDTAGRLQNKQHLMDELQKINKVLKKIDETAPHENILVVDATTGQNAKNQLEIFDKVVNINGLVVTKLDGSAKGGIVVCLADQFKKPIYAIGIGEKISDLQEFDAKDFAKNLLNLK